MTETVFTQVSTMLGEVEEQEQVRVCLAVESGSRAWGFPSADSDYDVRFVYVHRPEWYLSIEDGRDVIERPLTNAIDLSGWDIRKALRLFRKSNPLIEREMTRFGTRPSNRRDSAPPTSELDRLFRNTLEEIWAP